MKTIPLPEFEDDPEWAKQEAWANDGVKIFCSYRERIDDLLPKIDQLLEPFGLEVVKYDDGSTDFFWEVVKRDG